MNEGVDVEAVTALEAANFYNLIHINDSCLDSAQSASSGLHAIRFALNVIVVRHLIGFFL